MQDYFGFGSTYANEPAIRRDFCHLAPTDLKLKNIARRSLGFLGYDVIRHSRAPSVPRLRDEFTGVRFAGVALQTLLDHYEFTSVLDIGSGAGEHADILRRHGKKV